MINRLNKNILSLAAIALFAISCTQTKEIKPTIVEEDAAVNATATSTDEQNAGPTIVSSNPEAVVNGRQVSAPNVATTINPKAQKVAPGMNPAHGEPGHRCDISVGAPLNSPPGNTAALQQTVMPTPAPTPAPVANPMNLAVNPAHGEPGHSCAIAVGAPFK